MKNERNFRLSRRAVLAGGTVALALTTRFGTAAPHRSLSASVSAFGARGDGASDDTAAINKALATRLIVHFEDGEYRVNGPLHLRSGQVVTMAPGTIIRQQAVNQPIFTALRQGNIHLALNGATLFGEGAWSPEWVGNSGHYDRGLYFLGCDDVTVEDARIRNCAHAGICFIGGERIRIVRPDIQGTHRFEAPIPEQGNFQMGIYLKHDPEFGAVDDVVIHRPVIGWTAQGVLSELEVGAPVPKIGLRIEEADIHDITGQHAFYIQAGKVTIINPRMRDIALSGVKIQAGDANLPLREFRVTGAVGHRVRSQLFEVAVPEPYTGMIGDLHLEGSGTQVGRGLGATRRVSGLRADIKVSGCSDAAIQLNGPDLRNIDITIEAEDIGGDGVVVYATNSRDIRIRPTIRNPNFFNGRTACGIRVESPSAEVELVNPDVSDSHGRMHYGLFNAIAGSTVRVTGSNARFVGAADTAVRATGKISGLPENAELNGANGDLLGTGYTTV